MENQAFTMISPLRKSPLEVGSLARISLAQLANLPAEPGLYLAVDNANRVWYVGLAESIRERLVGHDRIGDFKDRGVTAIAWRREESPLRRRSIEQELIEYFHPPLNDQHNFHGLPSIDLGLTAAEEVERFLRLRVQQKLIELELELLKPNIVTQCELAVGDKLQHTLGTIRRQSYTSWQYSPDIERKSEALKLAKQEEQNSGVAKIKSITVSPVARLNASVLVDEIRILLSGIEASQDVEEMSEAL